MLHVVYGPSDDLNLLYSVIEAVKKKERERKERVKKEIGRLCLEFVSFYKVDETKVRDHTSANKTVCQSAIVILPIITCLKKKSYIYIENGFRMLLYS